MMTNSTNALLRSQQQLNTSGTSLYQNINGPPSSLGMNKAIQPNTQNAQQKYLSKSPIQQNKLISNTNYGKFKMMPAQNPQQVTQAYVRGGGQYLPKLSNQNIKCVSNYQGVIDRQQSQNSSHNQSSGLNSRNNQYLQSMQQISKVKQPGEVSTTHTASGTAIPTQAISQKSATGLAKAGMLRNPTK